MRVYLLLLFMCYRKFADYFFANCAVAVAEDVYGAAYRFAYAYAFNGMPMSRRSASASKPATEASSSLIVWKSFQPLAE